MWDTCDLDKILQSGNQLYGFLQRASLMNNIYTLVTELTHNLEVFDTLFDITIGESLAGFIGRNSDSINADVVMCLGDAFQKTLTEFSACLVTFTGATFAVIKSSGSFYVFDCHARNLKGMQAPDGKSVLLKLNSIHEVTQHCCKLLISMSVHFSSFL